MEKMIVNKNIVFTKEEAETKVFGLFESVAARVIGTTENEGKKIEDIPKKQKEKVFEILFGYLRKQGCINDKEIRNCIINLNYYFDTHYRKMIGKTIIKSKVNKIVGYDKMLNDGKKIREKLKEQGRKLSQQDKQEYSEIAKNILKPSFADRNNDYYKKRFYEEAS